MATTRDSGTSLGASVGLTDADLLEMYRYVALARALDERMWILNRAGRIPFVISGQGHEGAQVGIAWAFQRGHDWIAPFYRSIATCLTFGMHPRDILTAQYATANDPSSGGRQMPGHYGSHEHNLVSVSSPVATQLLHAVGIALAAKIRKSGQVAMTSMGEGSSNQGDVHEGLNFAAIHQLPFVFVVENNGYAISVPLARQVAGSSVADRAAGYGIPGVTVDGSDVLACYAAARDAVARARAGDGPTLIEAKVLRLTAHSSDDQQTKYRSEEELAAERARDPLPMFRDQLRDAGVLDEATEARMAAAVKAAVDDATDYAESQPDPDPATAMRYVYAERPSPTRACLMVARTFIEAIRETLADEMRRDESVIVLGEDVGKKGGVFLATDGLWAEFGDDRVIDTPLTESMIVGTSIGAAVNGLRPVCEIQFADFIFPAFNQIVSEAARMRYRSNNGYGVPDGHPRAVRRRRPRRALPLAERRGVLHPRPRASRSSCPRRPYDARGLLRSSIRDDDPVLFFEHKKMYRSVRGDVPETDYVVPLGKAAVTHPGSHVTVIAYGLMAHYALEAADRVADDGISVEVVDVRTLRPLDRETVLESVRKTGKCLVVYEDNKFGGYGAEIAAIVAEEAFDYLDGPVTRVAGPEVPARALQPRPRGVVHGQPREDRGRDPDPGGVLRPLVPDTPDLATLQTRLEAVLDPYRDRLEAFDLYGAPYLRRPGRQGPRLVRRGQRGQGRDPLLPAPDAPPPGAARRDLARAAQAQDRGLAVRVQDAR